MVTNQVLKPIVTSRAYAQIAQQISDAIASGVFGPGTKLPAERVMAEQLRVSRATVGEALTALEVLGLVESRVGDGTYVLRNPSQVPLLSSMLAELSQTQESPLEVIEARSVIEPPVAALAAEKATPDQLTSIESCVADMREAIRQGQSHVDADVKFHMAIATATGNNVLVREVSALVGIMHSKLWHQLNVKVSSSPLDLEAFLGDHQRIHAAICSRDRELASSEMSAHLARVLRLFFAE